MADEFGNVDFDDFEGFDTDPFDMNEVRSGDTVDKEGEYHFEVTEVVPELGTVKSKDNSKANTPHVKFVCTVMQSVKGQSPEGSKFYHRVFFASKEGGEPADFLKEQALLFGVATQVLREVEVNGKLVCVDTNGEKKLHPRTFAQAKGKQFIGVVKRGQKTDKYPNPGLEMRKFFHPEDAQVEDVPKNRQALQMAGYAVKAAGAKAAGGKNGAASTAASKGAAASTSAKSATGGASAAPAKSAAAAAAGDDDTFV